VTIPLSGAEGVLLSQGDAQTGFTFYMARGCLHHLYRHRGGSWLTSSGPLAFAPGRTTFTADIRRTGLSAEVSLIHDEAVVGHGPIGVLAADRVAYSGIDVGCDRGVPVGPYDAPNAFDAILHRVRVEVAEDQVLDEVAILRIDAAMG